MAEHYKLDPLPKTRYNANYPLEKTQKFAVLKEPITQNQDFKFKK